ncbi:MAG: diguanylate cyclase [Candidatus Hydrothermales bacterium]
MIAEIYIDELTRLKNRRYLFEKGENIIESFKSGSFLLIDLDNFKEINDRYGHLTGDEVLKAVSKFLNSIFDPGENELLRYAGDEFVVISNIKEKNKIEEKCRNFLEKIKDYQAPNLREKIRLGASIGISIFPEEGFSVKELFEKSDSALYFGKRKGKFQYRFYNEVEEEIKKEKFLREKCTPSELVNREKEIESLREFIKRGEPPLHLKGVHGIGKTRLISFFIDELIKENKKFIKVTFKEELKDVPFSSLCEVFEKKHDEIPSLLNDLINRKEIDFIILDDTDYIDRYSREIFISLSKEFKSILSAGTESVDWKNKELKLSSLNKENIKIYIKKIIPEIEEKEEFIDWVYKISQGIPNMIEECLRYAILKNFISIKYSRFILNELPEDKPNNITEIYFEKVKSVDRELRNFIVSLSVLGKSFKVNIASKYVGINPGRFIELADKAVNLYILEYLGRESYSFVNENFRRFLYDKLSDDSKRKMHKRIIDIAQRIKEIPEEVLLGSLLFHSKLAGETKEAFEASLKLSEFVKKLEERADIKKILEKRKILRMREVPAAPVPEAKDFPLITENLIALFSCIESYRIYPESSKIVFENTKKFVDSMNILLKKRKSLTLSSHEGNLIVDGILFPNQRLLAAQKIVEILNEFEIQSISFVHEIDDDDVKTFLQILSKRPSEVKNKGGVENLEETERLKNILINQKVYVALGEELEIFKKIPVNIEEKIKETLNLIKQFPEENRKWLGSLRELIRELKEEDLRVLFTGIPEDERILSELYRLESKEAMKVRETLEKALKEAESTGKVEETIKIRKLIKYVPERRELIESEKKKILSCEREDLLKDENQKILKEIFDNLSSEEKKEVLKKLIQNLSDYSTLIKGKTLEVLKNYLEYEGDFLLRESFKLIKNEKDEKIIKNFLELFINKIEDKIEKGEFEDIQDFTEIIVKFDFPHIESKILEKLSEKYINLKKAGKKEDLIRIRALLRIMERTSISFLIDKVEKEPLLSDLLKEMLKERVKSSEEFIYSELKKEIPQRILEILFETLIDENIKVDIDILRNFLEHRSDSIKLKALEAIIISESSEATKIIEDLMNSSNTSFKIQLIKLIGKYKIESLLNELIKFIEKKGKFVPEPDPTLVKEVIYVLSNFKENYAVGEAIVEALKPEGPFSTKKSKPPEIRVLLIRALKNFEPLPDWVEIIEKLTNDPNAAIRSSAKLLLGEWKKRL